MADAELAQTMSRQDKALICALAACEGLVEKGLLEGGQWKLTEGGRATYARLKAEGFVATPAELRAAMRMLQTEVTDDAR